MSDDIAYNQIIFLTNDSFTCQTVKKSFIEKGKLILVLKDLHKIIIAGENIDTSGHKNEFVNWYQWQKKKNLIYERIQSSIIPRSEMMSTYW